MKRVLVITIVLMLLFTISLLAQASGKQEGNQMMGKTYPGFISDVLCGAKGMDTGGNDLTKEPWKHTLACLKMPPCVASGFGVFIRTNKGYYKFYKLDLKSSEMALKNIVNKTKKKSNIYVLVQGEINPEGMLTATSIKEIKMAKS